MLLYILLGAIVTAVVAFAGIAWFGIGREPEWLRTIFGIAVGLTLGLGFMCMVISSDINSGINYLHNTYDDLMLYHSTVSNSTNEYLRYDYFDKVTAYNAIYNSALVESENFWVGNMYPADWDMDIGTVDFQLHGDSYGG